jgi:hypothetical protein
MTRDEIVEVIAHAIEDWVENSVDYDLSRAAAKSAITAIVAMGGPFLIGDDETMQELNWLLDNQIAFHSFADGGLDRVAKALARIAAALPKEGK